MKSIVCLWVALISFTMLSGCETTSELLEPAKVDYKSAGKLPDLEVPPDLVRPKRDDRFVVPDVGGKGAATYSAYQQDRAISPSVDSDTVLPKVSGITIERDGAERWLVVAQSPEKLWAQLKEFWQEAGFIINSEAPQVGVMETDWAENRAKIPDGFIRNALGKALDTFYSTSERDKFRTRLEPGKQAGTTEIYISHRGMIEVYINEGKSDTRWQPRSNDPDLEAEMLRRLMIKLGADRDRAKAMLVKTAVAPGQARATLLPPDGSGVLEIKEPFDRAWRNIGLALDHSNFTIEDRDRTKGEYFVRYADSDADIANQGKEGLLSKLAFWKDKPGSAQPAQYRITVKSDNARSTVTVAAVDSKMMTDVNATKKILKILLERLK